MLNQEEFDLFMDVSNPLDCVEEVMAFHDWSFERHNEDELTVEVSGKYGHYSMSFLWQDGVNALQFSSKMDLTIHASKIDEAKKTMSDINASLWLGHFDLDKTANQPSFRHTSLMRGMTEGSGAPYLEDMIQIAIVESERYYMAFDLLSKTTTQDNSDLTLALMDVSGVA